MVGVSGDFNEYRLIPADTSYINTRTECNTKTEMGGVYFGLPAVVPSMRGIVSEKVIENVEKHGGVVIQPRGVETYARVIARNSSLSTALEVAEKLPENGILSIEIANGHMARLLDVVKEVREFRDDIKIWAGTVITAEAVNRLGNAGADAVIIGIGPSSACSTTNKTGVGLPPMRTVIDCATANYPVILAGGLREPKDFVLALAAGADACMIGGLLKGCSDLMTPGLYYGMASEFEKPDRVNLEGVVERVDRRDKTSADVMQELEEGLKSAMSYCDSSTLKEFRHKAKIIRL